MKCLNCDKEAIGKSKYCSDRCKVSYNRNRQTVTTVTYLPTVTVTESTVTPKTVTTVTSLLPANFGQPDCECYHCKQNRSQPATKQFILNHGPKLSASQLMPGQVNRVSLPGDIDYSLVN